MDYMTIILATLAAMGVVAMAWIGGYQVGSTTAISVERDFADRRIKGLLDSLNEKPPRLRYRKVDPRKVGRKRYLNSKLKEVA